MGSEIVCGGLNYVRDDTPYYFTPFFYHRGILLSVRTLLNVVGEDGMNGVSFTAVRMPMGWGHVAG